TTSLSTLCFSQTYTCCSCNFSSPGKTHTHFDLKQYKTGSRIFMVIKAIHDVQYIGGLTSVKAFSEGAKQADVHKGGRPGLANKIMIIFTDGWQNKGPDPGKEAKLAEALGFKIYSVSVIPTKKDAIAVNEETLEAIVQSPQTEHFTDKNFPQLINIVRQKNLKCFGHL
uniref:VWFA domain-containing protein n=1 Tax=Meloidogyne incognita TaxID=6306 RepID=A0A914NYF5_MELIC